MTAQQDATTVLFTGNSRFVLPHPVATSVAQAEQNLDYILAIFNEDRPGHDVKLPLDVVSHPGFVYVMAMLTALKNSM